MKRKQPTKHIQRRRRIGRLRKLKVAALSLGLATAWGGSADAALFNATATATLTLSDSAAVSCCTAATATIVIEGINDLAPGTSASGIGSIPGDLDLRASDSGYYYVGKSGDDIVLSFPNGGAGAIGEFWGALFLNNGQGVTEGQLLDDLGINPLANGVPLDPASALGQIDKDYGQLLRTPYGEEATLVAFQFIDAQSPNNGVAAGTFRMSVIPEPATFAMVASAMGIAWAGVRRRE